MPLVTVGTGAGDATDARVRLEMETTLQAKDEEMEPEVRGLWLETRSNKRDERYHVWQSIGVIVRHPRGQDISEDSFEEASARIVNHRWSKSVEWLEEDEEDDQTGMLVARVQQYAIRYSALRMDILAQILETTTDDDLLPADPVSYDGSGLFLGATRFGQANGNIVTGSVGTAAYSSVQEIHTDVWAAITRKLQYQDTRGRPYWTPAELRGDNLVLVVPPQLVELATEAFEQQMIFRTDGSSVTGAIAGAGVSNVFIGGRYRPTVVLMQQLSDTNNMYLLVGNQAVKPFVRQMRKDMSSQPYGPENDGSARKRYAKGRQWTERAGYGIWEPRCATEINNS